MTSQQLAKALAAGLARHQTRGLVDETAGMTDVVIHGRVDLLAVADELIALQRLLSRSANRSWAPWFAHGVAQRREARRLARKQESLVEQLAGGASEAAMALIRLRLRNAEVDLADRSGTARAGDRGSGPDHEPARRS